MPDPEPYEPAALTGNAPADLQAETARLSGEWKLGKLNEISDEQAREDLGRLSAQMMAIVARSAAHRGRPRAGAGRRRRAGRDRGREVPAALARRGRPAARQGDRHLLDLHRRARPQRVDVHRARRRLDRRRLRRGAVVGGRRALGPAARRRARVRDADARRGRGARRRRARGCATRSTSAKRIMGFGHRVYRAEDPRSRILKRTAQGARLAARRGRRGARAGRARGAAGAPSRARARDERRVLLGGRARRRRDPAAARAGDVRVLARRRLVGAHPRAEAHRAALPAVRALRRSRRPRSLAVGLSLAEAAVEADALAESGNERELAELRADWADELEAGGAIGGLPRAGGRLPRGRPVPLPAEGGAAAARPRGREPGLPRLGAALARAALARAPARGQLGPAAAAQRSRTPTTTRPSAGSRSSRCGTARRSATRSSSCRGSPRRKGSPRRRGRPRRRSPPSSTSARRLASGSRRRGRGARGRRTGRSGGGASTRARSSAVPPRTSAGRRRRSSDEHREVWIGGHRVPVIPARHVPETFRRRACGWLRK